MHGHVQPVSVPNCRGCFYSFHPLHANALGKKGLRVTRWLKQWNNHRRLAKNNSHLLTHFIYLCLGRWGQSFPTQFVYREDAQIAGKKTPQNQQRSVPHLTFLDNQSSPCGWPSQPSFPLSKIPSPLKSISLITFSAVAQGGLERFTVFVTCWSSSFLSLSLTPTQEPTTTSLLPSWLSWLLWPHGSVLGHAVGVLSLLSAVSPAGCCLHQRGWRCWWWEQSLKCLHDPHRGAVAGAVVDF